ncbi:MAG: hypothetical protein HOO88_07170 [Kiritimatiellaceae bacterium]|jgi:hypothetical protein|nr:hypothetical protein [Kiritimatiellaceae bacterium]
MDLIDKIKTALDAARDNRTKTATFHSMILIHAKELEDRDALDFCRRVGIEDVWKVEFKRMISAARMLRELGFDITKK